MGKLVIISVIKPFYYISRFMGLFTFSITKSRSDNVDIIDDSLSKNVVAMIWTSIITVVIAGAFVYSVFHATGSAMSLENSAKNAVEAILTLQFSYLTSAEFFASFSRMEVSIMNEKSYSSKTNNKTPECRITPLDDNVIYVFDNSVNFKRQQNHMLIHHFRGVYGNIYNAVKFINSMYGPYILAETLNNFFTSIEACAFVYQRMSQPHRTMFEFISSLGWAIFFLSKQVSITLSCHMVSTQTKTLMDHIQNLLLIHPIKDEFLQQLRLFKSQLSKNKIEFTAFGVFTLSISVLLTFVASAFAQILFIVQLKLI
ncbi:hypothetical protein L9F63_000162 [Diploptera punctata]|uniref:Gustatory receptor n=1 Tax=Diploptera punctata TaxID=6984 RepID=A0AAD8ETH0_DIPPU|nr:hypothetical protein L9F63_000162 [Diploptera punctata]